MACDRKCSIDNLSVTFIFGWKSVDVVMANTGVWTELLFLALLTFLLFLLPSAQGAPANFWWWDDPAYDLDFVYDFGGIVV